MSCRHKREAASAVSFHVPAFSGGGVAIMSLSVTTIQVLWTELSVEKLPAEALDFVPGEFGLQLPMC